MAGKTREKMKSEIVRLRIREMYPQGFSAKAIADATGKSEAHIRNIIGQEFPNGRPARAGHA